MIQRKQLQVSTKTFNDHGKWIDKPTRSVIVVCSSCESRYIKTRANQKTCLKCMGKASR